MKIPGKSVDKEELGEWKQYPQTEHYLELLEKEILKVRKNYDTIEKEGEGKFKKTQGHVYGLLKAISILKNIANMED